MSMVGHILGLGDRHGENLLLDQLTGELVHIDLNCLFWKGQLFTVPECVPFRLTPNMIDALGVTGYEGVFRGVCEITLSILRDNRETLMSILQPLLDDPLAEATNEDKKQNFVQRMSAVNKLLKGQFGLLPLSVQGHVQKLLEEATSPANLSKVSWSTTILRNLLNIVSPTDVPWMGFLLVMRENTSLICNPM